VRASSLFLIVLLVELAVVCFWLLTSPDFDGKLLGLYSLYVLWILLPIFLIFSALSSFYQRHSKWVKQLLVLGVVLYTLWYLLVELVVQGYVLSQNFDLLRLLRHWAVLTLVLMLAMRGWVLLNRYKRIYQAELETRLNALQARIQPHFLFNSLNTVAELTATAPDKAEQAVESLSMLFRVSLENQKLFHSLKQEITLCKKFVELESFRTEGGINIEYDISIKSTRRWSVPKLLLQPLVENAIKYGNINPDDDPIKLIVSETKSKISIKLMNSISENQTASPGNGIAIQNIKDRLFAIYDHAYTFSQRELEGVHHVIMQIRKRKYEAV